MSALKERKPLRLPGFDYSQRAAYFVTVCTQQRECTLGQVVDGQMVLTDGGRMVQSVWEALPTQYPQVNIDAFVVMPNHIHGILFLNDIPPVGAQFIAPDEIDPQSSTGEYAGVMDSGVINQAPTNDLGKIIRTFKGKTSFLINQHRGTPRRAVWQRGYYDHIVRDEADLNRIREYITNNPAQWALDHDNPNHLEPPHPSVGAQFIAPGNPNGHGNHLGVMDAGNSGVINHAPTHGDDGTRPGDIAENWRIQCTTPTNDDDPVVGAQLIAPGNPNAPGDHLCVMDAGNAGVINHAPPTKDDTPVGAQLIAPGKPDEHLGVMDVDVMDAGVINHAPTRDNDPVGAGCTRPGETPNHGRIQCAPTKMEGLLR